MRNQQLEVDGFTATGWSGVADAFACRGEAGAAVCVYYNGQPVVDLAAGTADPDTGQPYTRNTLQPIMSVSKGLVAIAINMLADRQVIDLNAPVARCWPEFAKASKQDIAVTWLLTHQAGLAAIDQRFSLAEVLSWQPVIKALEEQEPNWPPGSAHGYHSMTYGFLLGELIRRTTGQLPGAWVAEHISGPLGAHCYLGLPQGMHDAVTPVLPFPPAAPGQVTTLRLDPESLPYRAAFGFTDPPLSPLAVNDPAVQAAELPAANGVANARSLARIFAALIGKVDGVRLLSSHSTEQAWREQARGPDLAAIGMTDSALGLGFNLPTEARPLGGAGSFGSLGLGGCRTWALPEANLAFAYLPKQLLDANPDPREVALAAATLTSVQVKRPAVSHRPAPANWHKQLRTEGPPMRIDVHSHFQSVEFVRHLVGSTRLPRASQDRGTYIVDCGAGLRVPSLPELLDVEAKLDAMDRVGVDVSVLSHGLPLGPDVLGGEADEWAMRINDDLASLPRSAHNETLAERQVDL
jgi:CubicO group peptidase (beta-lactamase class C family)